MNLKNKETLNLLEHFYDFVKEMDHTVITTSKELACMYLLHRKEIEIETMSIKLKSIEKDLWDAKNPNGF
jgi:hypothetical protein